MIRFRKYYKYVFTLIFIASTTPSAFAASQLNSLGDLINNMGASIYKSVPMLVIVGCFVFSIWLAADSLRKLYLETRAGGRPGEHGNVWIRLAVAGCFAVLPSALDVGIGSIFSEVPTAVTGGHTYAPQICMIGTNDESAALTCVARNIGVNVVPVGIKFIFSAMYLSGMFIFVKALYGLAKHHHMPTQGGASKQVAHMGVASLMLAMPTFINDVTSTMGYGNLTLLVGNSIGVQDQIPSILAYGGDGSANSGLTKFHQLISWCFVIVSLFGVWYVAVGINKLNAGVDGGGQDRHGVRSALTHIIGGSMMINGKLAMCLIVTTFIGNGRGFC